jgi:hypothetical protein
MHRGEDEGQPVGCHAVPDAAVRAVGIAGHAAEEGEEEGGQRARRAAELLADLCRSQCHYMIQPLVELYGGCMVVLKASRPNCSQTCATASASSSSSAEPASTKFS